MTSTDLPRVKLLEFQVRTTLDINQVKLSRCLIYKVQSAETKSFQNFFRLFTALGDSFFIISGRFRFVKNFFRFFPIFFDPRRLSAKQLD